MPFSFKFMGNAGVGHVIDKVAAFTQDDWEAYNFRQKKFDAHKDTFTVPLIFSERFFNRPVVREHYPLFKDVLDALTNLLLVHYHSGYMVRAMLVNLPAGKAIGEHVDVGTSLTECHRLHIPIITNDKVLFSVGDETIRMQVGEIWEINNSGQRHSVRNLGANNRVHLIIDWRTHERTV